MTVALNQEVTATPIIKWVGGKTRILPAIARAIDEACEGLVSPRFIDPFMGGGSVLLQRAQSGLHSSCIAADRNERLIRTFAAVRDDVDGVIHHLEPLACSHSKETFSRVRARFDDDDLEDRELAASFIYLNKTCYNGLYRVNSQGRFNVPFGDYKSPRALDEFALRNFSRALQRVELLCESFETTLYTHVRAGDVLYCDPPYVGTFSSFTPEKFSTQDQKVLVEVLKEVSDAGARVVVSQSYAAKPLYEEAGFRIREVATRKSVGCKDRRESIEIIATRGF